MEFKKGDRVVHLGLKLVGTFMKYAWNSDEEAIVKFDNEDNPDDCRHISVNQLIMERYIECPVCGKSLTENSVVVAKTDSTDKYCSYGCAAIGSGLFKKVELTDKVVQDDKSCGGKDWLMMDEVL